MKSLLAAADAAERVLAWIAEATGWLMLVLMAVICIDIVTRKAGIQLPGMGSTRLQELEWHLHTVIFCGWLGYCYLLNAHPRVDSVTERLSFRKRAWIELTGCIVFALPYGYVCVHHGIDLAWDSWKTGETSEAVVGLPWRWLIKGLFAAGLVLMLVAVVAMTIRLVGYHLGYTGRETSGLPLDKAVEPM